METEYVVNDITSLEDVAELDKARQVGEALNEAYPGHLWLVCWQGGALVVKNLVMGSHYGMVLKDSERYSASALKKHAIQAGGEFLERAGLPRGKWDGTMPKVLEGSDPKIWRPM